MARTTITTEVADDTHISPERTVHFPAGPSGAIALLCNPIVMNATMPFKFDEGCVLDRATGTDLDLIRQRLNALSPSDGFGNLCKRYEEETIALKTPLGIGQTVRPLSKDLWRYYIVKSDDRGASLKILHEIANITDTPIDLQSLIVYSATGFRYQAETFKRHYDGIASDRLLISIDNEELIVLKSLYLKWKRMAGEKEGGEEMFPEISRALAMFDAMKFLPAENDFKILSLFAIAEMLITHEPQTGDASISKQIRRKMPLLLKRAPAMVSVPVDLYVLSTEKLWNALYDLRSSIAHGSVTNFNKGAHAVLKSQKNSFEYLRSAVSALIILAINDPQLLRDIKLV